MKKYVYIDENNRTKEVVYSDTKQFPNIEIDKLFPEYFVKRCVEVELNFDFKEGMDYNWETGEFSEHIDEVIPQILENEIIEEVVGNVAEE